MSGKSAESPESLAKQFKIEFPTELRPDDQILVVDPQQDMRMIVIHHLQKLSFRQLKYAANGLEALEIIRDSKKPFGAIIASLDMPIMSGYDLITELRETPEIERGAFIGIMSAPSKEQIMLAMEHGVDDIVVKPFTLNDIMPKIRSGFRLFHNPKNPEKLYERAKRDLREECYHEASEIYKALVKHTKCAARPLVGLARIARKQGDLSGALKNLDEAIKRNKNFVHAYTEQGNVYAAQGKIEEAVSCYKTAIELSPLNPVRYQIVIDLLFEEKRHKDAIVILEKAESNGLDFPSLYNYLSQGYFHVKDFAKAMKYIRQALGREPENIAFMNQLGICHRELEQYDDAMKVYNQIIKFDPSNKSALYNKSILLHAKGQINDAIKILSRVIKNHPEFAPAAAKLNEFEAQVHNKAS